MKHCESHWNICALLRYFPVCHDRAANEKAGDKEQSKKRDQQKKIDRHSETGSDAGRDQLRYILQADMADKTGFRSIGNRITVSDGIGFQKFRNDGKKEADNAQKT